jgi:predicted acyltransferase
VAIAVPISKPLWTPSFVLVTAGISAAALAYALSTCR